ncbi:hypothetical protein [Bacillus sp. FJAT-27445]|uniref:hypothetical protein n=1 Tax=Bacillus sp. FJAT-27445 TaxID=1679166 RepID=UPI00074452B0|nr:hypothetical protein [Bacillus sp. FJAT-27445]
MKNTSSDGRGIKFVFPEDCGNSPKKRFLIEFIIAIAKKDIEFIADSVTDHIHWQLVGNTTIIGKDKLADKLKKDFIWKIVEIEVLDIITHGKSGAVNGTFKIEDGRQYAFCNVYNFVSAGKSIVKKIATYIIEL